MKPETHATAPAKDVLDPLDPLDPHLQRRLVLATQHGLPRVARPYDALAAQLGVSPQTVQDALGAMLASGRIRRIGAVPNHYALGYTANGMSVWDVDDAALATLGPAVGALPGVSHCYRRPRHLPDWPWNLFVKLHGETREEVEDQCAAIAAVLGPACRGHEMLFSTRVLKSAGMRLAEGGAE